MTGSTVVVVEVGTSEGETFVLLDCPTSSGIVFSISVILLVLISSLDDVSQE
ncbi:MAG: hypothetical protein LBQ24_01125 [Candidatus Peribacteria bacterium]|nr:hypothetical protein [Candidatus Peribacteria bacterium]